MLQTSVGSGDELTVSGVLPAEADQSSSSRAALADTHVGSKIRARRTMLGLTQSQLAGMVGITCQQMHKYERGINRVSAGRLFEIADAMAITVAWFFEGLDSTVAQEPPMERKAIEIARDFAAIDNQGHREALAQMARALALQSLSRKTAK